ncbi:MAG TPA: PP2C family serine/threonine-protein phosphatase [Acidobacteriaceae bacterium]
MTPANPWLPEAAAESSTGRVRSRNEDSFGYLAERGIFIVCDGMGGAAGGEIASQMTVKMVLERMATEAAAEAGCETLRAAIADANRAVHERGERDAGLYGMGTTLVALVLRPGPGGANSGCAAQSESEADSSTSRRSGSAHSRRAATGTALIAHAGDSRCYLFRGEELRRCTHDHSLVDEQMRLGTMTREEADRSPFRSVITRAVGTQQSVSEEVKEMPVEPGDVFLLCSDGLTREVSEVDIAAVLSSESGLTGAAKRLVEAANDAGGRDNVTCLLVRVP